MPAHPTVFISYSWDDEAHKEWVRQLATQLRADDVDARLDRKLAEITIGEIDSWLRGLNLAPLTRNTFRLRLSVLFEYARERGWIETNRVSDVRKVRVSDSLPGIFTPEEVARLLEAADDETLPYWALGVFAGLRSAELERLAWKDMHFDEKLIEAVDYPR